MSLEPSHFLNLKKMEKEQCRIYFDSQDFGIRCVFNWYKKPRLDDLLIIKPLGQVVECYMCSEYPSWLHVLL